jgi:TrpR family trp operon transcriptional repressor
MPQRPKKVKDTANARDVAEAIARLSSADEINQFLDEILTPTERHDIALRWELLERLKAGVPQREIAEKLHISLCKITRGSRILKNPNAIIPKLLDAKSETGRNAPPT